MSLLSPGDPPHYPTAPELALHCHGAITLTASLVDRSQALLVNPWHCITLATRAIPYLASFGSDFQSELASL